MVTTRDVYSLYYPDFQLLLPLFWSCCKCQPWSYHLWKKWLSVGVNYHFVFVSNFLFLYPFTQYFCKYFSVLYRCLPSNKRLLPSKGCIRDFHRWKWCDGRKELFLWHNSLFLFSQSQGLNSLGRTGYTKVVVNILDIDDNDPIFDNPVYTLNIPEEVIK